MGKKCLFLVCLLAPWAVWADIAGTDPAMLKKCEGQVDQAMDAYNSKSWKDFFKDFAKASAALCPEQSFTTVYVNTAQRDFGNYESRALDEGRSTFHKSVGLPTCKGKCFKKCASLNVNFLQEGRDWEIQQIRIDP